MQQSGNVHRHRRTHGYFQLEITQDNGARDDIEIPIEPDVAWPDEGVVKAANLRMSHIRPRAPPDLRSGRRR